MLKRYNKFQRITSEGQISTNYVRRTNFASKASKFLLLFLFLIYSGTIALAKEEAAAVILETEPIAVEEPGIVTLGDVSITALESKVITPKGVLSLKIPANFPAVWDKEAATLSLTKDSSSGLVNEAVTYPDEKTLRIIVTRAWRKNARITITNLKVDILEFPTYEELFSGSVANMAYLQLTTENRDYPSTNPILLKISPLYTGDDGWSIVESDLFPKALASFSITGVTSSYATQLLVNRGFTAVVRALDGNDNFRAAATDNVVLSSYLSTDPNTSGQVNFYTDNTYATAKTGSLYGLSSGRVTIYAKDATIESIVLKATQEDDSRINGASETVAITPYKYSVTNNYPQPIVNMEWEEEVQVQDAAGQDITTTPPSQATLSSDGNIKFYADSNYSGDGTSSLAYSLSSGKCTIYMKDAVSETLHIQVDDTYSSRSNDGGGTSIAFTVLPALINVHLDFSYDEEGGSGGTTDKLTIRAWIEKNGLIVSSDLGTGSLAIYDFDSLDDTITVSTVPTDGIYWFTKENTGLSAGQGYFALATITYQTLEYKSGGNFYVTMDKEVLSQVEDISTKVDELKVSTTALSDEILEEITPTLEDIEDKTDRTVTATEETIPTQIDDTRDTLQPHIVSHILNTETLVKQGEKLNVRYRTYPDLSPRPVLDVYRTKDDVVEQMTLPESTMDAVTGTDGVYELEVKFDSTWGKGFFTVICSESTHGTLDGITINVISTSLEQVGRDITAVIGSTSDLTEIGKTQDIIDERFGEITDKLSNLNVSLVQAVAATVGAVASELGREQTTGIYLMMSEISEGLQSQGMDIKGDIKQLYHVSEKGTGDIDYLRNKFIEMENLLLINQKMIDAMTYEPIIQTWYEFR